MYHPEVICDLSTHLPSIPHSLFSPFFPLPHSDPFYPTFPLSSFFLSFIYESFVTSRRRRQLASGTVFGPRWTVDNRCRGSGVPCGRTVRTDTKRQVYGPRRSYAPCGSVWHRVVCDGPRRFWEIFRPCTIRELTPRSLQSLPDTSDLLSPGERGGRFYRRRGGKKDGTTKRVVGSDGEM